MCRVERMNGIRCSRRVWTSAEFSSEVVRVEQHSPLPSVQLFLFHLTVGM